jgi:hypothetical protein
MLPDGRVIVSGGYTDATTSQSIITVELLDLKHNATNQSAPAWVFGPNMSVARSFHVGVTLANGKFWMFGGTDASGVFLGSSEYFDTKSNTFIPTATCPDVLASPSIVLLSDGNVLVSGGYSNAGLSAVSYRYDPEGDQFTQTQDMSFTRALQTAVLLPDGTVSSCFLVCDVLRRCSCLEEDLAQMAM